MRIGRLHLLGACAAAAPAAAQCVPQWSPLGSGCDWDVGGLAAVHFTQPFLGVAGNFDQAGNVLSPRFAGYAVQAGWASLTSETLGSEGLVAFHVAPEAVPLDPGLYVGGEFQIVGGVQIENIARWDGNQWHPLGGSLTSSEVNSWVASIERFADTFASERQALYVGGRFTSASGKPANGIASWDGAAWWVPPGLPATNSPGNTWPAIYDMAVFDDDGDGPRSPGLYVCGWIDHIDGVPMNDVARWDGRAWEPLGDGVGTTAHALCVFDDDGPGPRSPALFVGGLFSTSGVARWDGQSWSTVAALNSTVHDFMVWDDDGPGPRAPGLYAAGNFSGCVARWNGIGAGWHVLSGGLTGGLGFPMGFALAAWDEDDPGPNPGGLYVGGHFKFAGGVPANYIARWGCPLPPDCYPDCDADGALTLADFGCFQTKFAQGNMEADCNQDALLNLADFGCFQTAFALGCP